jgi:lambda repressor-like predicted transcriptional regulator
MSDVRAALDAEAEDRLAARRIEPGDPVADAIRLYEQGWSIRRVAEEFGVSYGAMRRTLGRHVTLRER